MELINNRNSWSRIVGVAIWHIITRKNKRNA